MTAPIRPELAAHLDSAYPGCTVRLLAGDASTRRFFRLTLPDGSRLVVMDYGAPFVGDTDDVALTRVFEDARLPVARIHSILPLPGCLLLEDLGDRTLEGAIRSAASESGARGQPGRLREDLYRDAVALAIAIATRGTLALERSERADGPSLDPERLRYEMRFFVEHYAKGLMGVGRLPARLEAGLEGLADAAASTPRRVLCHRDYHSRNLMVRDDATLAMVDIQDARWGPDTYDLASLLWDAYVDLDAELVEGLAEDYRARLPQPDDPPAFRKRLQVVACQRMIKALGTFGYQVGVLGRSRYLEGVPRTLARLRRLLPLYPATAAVGEEMERAGLLQEPPGLPPPA